MISFTKGDKTSVDGFLTMDTDEYNETDPVRVCSENNIYVCVTLIQANYLKKGIWLKELPNG